MEALRTFDHQGAVLELFAYDAGAPRPGRGAVRRAPGAGRVEVGALEVSTRGEGLDLTARVVGSNVAYVYIEVLLKDPDVDQYYGPVLREHVRAARHQVVRGVSLPCWEAPIEVAARARAELRLLTDEVDSAFCFSAPQAYGRPERLLAGLYTPAGAAAPLRAALTLDETGTIGSVLAYRAQGRWALPRMVIPGPGDTFAPFVQVHTRSSRNADWAVGTVLSAPLRFGDGRPRAISVAPLPGEYLAGLVVQDLDGRSTRAYAAVRLP